MYLLGFYAPIDAKEKIKDELFKQGAGKIGEYEKCCFEYSGMGQFKPLERSQPYFGTKGEISVVEEVKIEMVVSKDCIKEVIQALLQIHPYETPAYHVLEMLSIE